MNKETIIASLVAQFLALCIVLFLWAKMFEYSLWSIFEAEVPWYLDTIGAVVLNGVNLVIFVGCLIARAAGAEVPFYG